MDYLELNQRLELFNIQNENFSQKVGKKGLVVRQAIRAGMDKDKRNDPQAIKNEFRKIGLHITDDDKKKSVDDKLSYKKKLKKVKRIAKEDQKFENFLARENAKKNKDKIKESLSDKLYDAKMKIVDKVLQHQKYI